MDAMKVGRVSMILNPEDVETIELAIDIYNNDDHEPGMPIGISTVGSITLNSFYGNVAAMTFGGVTPEILREFADKLEAELIEVKEAIKE